MGAERAEFGLLGPLALCREGTELTLGGPKQRALLAILLLEANHAVSADLLIDALWGDRAPDTAKNTLQVYVSQLRKLLPEGSLATVAPGYRLAAEPEHLIVENPFRERLRAQLMLALYRSGRQAEALAVYQRTRRTLVDELGIEPGESLRQLEQAILAHDPSLDTPAGGGTAETIPAPPTPLLGRERELATLAELCRRDDVRLVTLTGIGGIGKTRLAVELARRLAAEFRDGARMAELATIHDAT